MAEVPDPVKPEAGQTLAGLVPEALFDILARLLPGLAFFFLIHVSFGRRLSNPAVLVDSIYRFLFLIAGAYLAGFLIEMLSLPMIIAFYWFLDPAKLVIFGADSDKSWKRHVSRCVTRLPLFGSLDTKLVNPILKSASRLLGVDLSPENASEVLQTIFDYIKLRFPAIAAVLLKIHAEAFMFKNLMAVCLITLITEVAIHRFRNLLFVIVLLLILVGCSIGFLYLSFLGPRRIYQSFLAIASADFLSEAKSDGKTAS